MVRAQTEIARQQGAAIIADVATSLRPTLGGVDADTARGGTLRAERVLVATGAFTDVCGLLPIDLKLQVFGRTVVNAGACGRRCNYDGRETEAGGQLEPTPPGRGSRQLIRVGPPPSF
jgi:glycine/D-amino acid oxidase-like deaminating enzyme